MRLGEAAAGGHRRKDVNNADASRADASSRGLELLKDRDGDGSSSLNLEDVQSSASSMLNLLAAGAQAAVVNVKPDLWPQSLSASRWEATAPKSPDPEVLPLVPSQRSPLLATAMKQVARQSTVRPSPAAELQEGTFSAPRVSVAMLSRRESALSAEDEAGRAAAQAAKAAEAAQRRRQEQLEDAMASTRDLHIAAAQVW